MQEYEKYLVGAWLRGENLEDLKWVKDTDFSEKELIEDLKKGKTMIEIGIERENLTELADISTYRSEVLYKQAFAQVMSRQIKHDIANMSSLRDVKAKLDYLEGVSYDNIEEFQDPAVALMNEFDERSHRQVIKWDKLPTLNEMTVGIKKKELTTISARPSVGKSTFALQIAYGAWKQGAKVLYFPLEMSTTQSYGRLLVMEKYATAKEVQTGRFNDQKKLQLGIDKVNEMYKSNRFKVYEGESLIENIESVIKREKPFLVVIDQLTQLRSKQSFKDIRAKFSYMTSNLKRIAMQEDVAIMLLCQINRSADNIEPTMANLKESGSIEEDSDNVIILHRLEAEDLVRPDLIDWKTTRPMSLNLAKQRDGETGKFRINFEPARYMFYELAREIKYADM